MPRRYDPAAVEDAACWLDTLLFRLAGRDSLRRAAELLAVTGVNQAGLDLRNVLREQAMLPDLRTLTIDWPLRLLLPSSDGPRPAVGAASLSGLLSLPLASSWPFDEEQAQAVREAGVEPARQARAVGARS